jgi:hypothetical protein
MIRSSSYVQPSSTKTARARLFAHYLNCQSYGLWAVKFNKVDVLTCAEKDATIVETLDHDPAQRVVTNPAYYRGSSSQLREALPHIAGRSCRENTGGLHVPDFRPAVWNLVHSCKYHVKRNFPQDYELSVPHAGVASLLVTDWLDLDRSHFKALSLGV